MADDDPDDRGEKPDRSKLSMEEVEARLDEVDEVLEQAQRDEAVQDDLIQLDDEPADATQPDKPNTARGPETVDVDGESTEAYIVALEMCARLPDDVRLPEEAADVVPVVVEASLRRRIEEFVAEEFGADEPRVDTLAFEESGDGIWMKLRVGIAPEHFADLAGHLDVVRRVAIQELDALFEERSFNE